mmetsp:Transcript_27901/g.81966  ORF Transcript_27901/g.81966 Transcript_27901/m.81966 type:complete len:242 (+) Transcript_27901:587-1312(+)
MRKGTRRHAHGPRDRRVRVRDEHRPVPNRQREGILRDDRAEGADRLQGGFDQRSAPVRRRGVRRGVQHPGLHVLPGQGRAVQGDLPPPQAGVQVLLPRLGPPGQLRPEQQGARRSRQEDHALHRRGRYGPLLRDREGHGGRGIRRHPLGRRVHRGTSGAAHQFRAQDVRLAPDVREGVPSRPVHAHAQEAEGVRRGVRRGRRAEDRHHELSDRVPEAQGDQELESRARAALGACWAGEGRA